MSDSGSDPKSKKTKTTMDQMAVALADAFLKMAIKNNITPEQLQNACGYALGKLAHEHTLKDMSLVEKACAEGRAYLDERCHCPAAKGNLLGRN